MAMNGICKVEGAGLQEIAEGVSLKTSENSKCKRLVRILIAAVCLMLMCLAVGDISAAEARCRRRARTRYYVVERPVVVRERCVRRYRPVRRRSCYVPCRRRVVRTYSYCAPRYKVIRRRPVYVPVWDDAPCGRRLVYSGADCGREIVYVED